MGVRIAGVLTALVLATLALAATADAFVSRKGVR
jgi:hypothetical protein